MQAYLMQPELQAEIVWVGLISLIVSIPVVTARVKHHVRRLLAKGS
jgi:hypothetical protein